MPAVEVIIPWFPNLSDNYRTRSFKWIRAQYLASGLPVRVATCRSKTFCKAKAVMPAIEASRASVIVVADADVWCDGVADAIEKVRWDCEPWAKPHKMVYRLNSLGTDSYLKGQGKDVKTLELVQHPYIGLIGGGIVVLTRDLALDIPLDERFIGWGGEDWSWGTALHTIAGPPWLGKADLVHFFHYPQKRVSRKVGNEFNEGIRKEYVDAIGFPHKMRKVVERGRRQTEDQLQTGVRTSEERSCKG